MYECYRDPNNDYTCLVLVNGREYQTDLSYESGGLAQENAAMRAFNYGLSQLFRQRRYACPQRDCPGTPSKFEPETSKGKPLLFTKDASQTVRSQDFEI
ncbi:hypothetical protein B0T16DRAFT_232999 [Cercophora newfieldiana]|uniref:DRBM domain-containing protein n=1 Tax=Cercophora newfieldiana TaxID=92897 RepID=A0AA39XRE6_9PEZI|nr:hypothetical protein B0T16DRAFT_232999 [Cercophora newfieldiana]